jgi:hypothetical protein
MQRVAGHLLPGLQRYVEHHTGVGGFLTSVLENDLFKAVGKADLASQQNLRDLTEFIYTYCPAECWGSPEKVAAWKAREPGEDSRFR